ncbi:MAG TPA: hypothetical protein VKB17_00785 [Thermoleophilaceae bacterium]|nr:hypothetical protein [Thermoleophilaceae bacterium]
MSQLTHPRAQILDLSFRFRAWLTVAAVFVVVAIPTALVIALDDEPAQSRNTSAPAAGLRYDGGPDEGTRGLVPKPTYSRSYSERGSDTLARRP